MRYLESKKPSVIIKGVVFVSGFCKKIGIEVTDNFVDKNFDYKTIKLKCRMFEIIHGDNDPYVPLEHAKILTDKLNGELIIIKNGEHLNGSAGYTSLPQCFEALEKMMN